jgi:ATP-binding cassette subfamily C (CFTR/MRP) protein 4
LCKFSTEDVILVYFGLTTGSFVLNILKGLLFFYVCIHAAQVLHNRMFAAVLRAPVRFFDTNPIGRITNRFSKDLYFLDSLLPFAFYDLLTVSILCA